MACIFVILFPLLKSMRTIFPDKSIPTASANPEYLYCSLFTNTSVKNKSILYPFFHNRYPERKGVVVGVSFTSLPEISWLINVWIDNPIAPRFDNSEHYNNNPFIPSFGADSATFRKICKSDSVIIRLGYIDYSSKN